MCERHHEFHLFRLSVTQCGRSLPSWAWTGATVNQIEPDPGNDGIWFMGYKVTNPVAGVWHYEYALVITRTSIERFNRLVCLWDLVSTSVTSDFTRRLSILAGQTTARLTARGTAARRGLLLRLPIRITWNSETFAQNQNANAIRWGTLYNFRFDADQPPQAGKCDGRLLQDRIAHDGCDPGTCWWWHANSDSDTNGDRYTDCHRHANATATPTATASTTPTATPRPTPTPRSRPPPRPRPTPPPRP